MKRLSVVVVAIENFCGKRRAQTASDEAGVRDGWTKNFPCCPTMRSIRTRVGV